MMGYIYTGSQTDDTDLLRWTGQLKVFWSLLDRTVDAWNLQDFAEHLCFTHDICKTQRQEMLCSRACASLNVPSCFTSST